MSQTAARDQREMRAWRNSIPRQMRNYMPYFYLEVWAGFVNVSPDWRSGLCRHQLEWGKLKSLPSLFAIQPAGGVLRTQYNRHAVMVR